MEKIKVFNESEIDDIQLSSSPSLAPMLDEVKKSILVKPGKAALLSEVVQELDKDSEKKGSTAALSGKFKRYCEKGKGDFKIVNKEGRNVLVRLA